jgi:predicted KAP-like P-loop ATPase
MISQQKQLPPLALPRIDPVGNEAFSQDLLQRKLLAEQLTRYLDRLREGAVLAIDAPWGEGKSWFGKNWAKLLKDQEHKVIFIDAFEQDYIEDPFLLIAAEIATVLDDGQGSAADFKEKASSVMKAILPFSTKVLVNLAGRIVLGSADFSEDLKEVTEAAQEGAADAAAKWIENKLEDYAQDKASLEQFRESVREFAVIQKKPVVIFIDELDRCKPPFAVSLIEPGRVGNAVLPTRSNTMMQTMMQTVGKKTCPPYSRF